MPLTLELNFPSSLEDLSKLKLMSKSTLSFVLMSIGLLIFAMLPKASATLIKSFQGGSPAKQSKKKAEPQWWVIPILNATVSLIFATSVFSHLNSPHSLHPVIWSACIVYFLGFFGIGFVDSHELQSRPSVFGLSDLVRKEAAKTEPLRRKNEGGYEHDFVKVCGGGEFGKSQPPIAIAVPTSPSGYKSLSNEELANLVLSQQIKDHTLEKILNPKRAVQVRRIVFSKTLQDHTAIESIPSEPSLDYSKVYGANCEICVGYIPLPVGMAGPLMLNGEKVFIPMATTEGCLVASTNRGCKAITASGGCKAFIVNDGITRAPCLKCLSAEQAVALAKWSEGEGSQALKNSFESTTSFGKLVGIKPTVAGKNVYLRLKCFSGDAMGMNMVSKGALALISTLLAKFPDVVLVALSGNMCTDKKPSAINWIEGRGKSVVIECTIKKEVVDKTLKTTVDKIVDVNLQKNLIGSAMSASVGGYNAHAANNVTAVFLATGQDPAQNVESSNCITLFEKNAEGDLWMSCTMPSIEVGTVGGGTGLAAQSACLKAIGVKGGGEAPGDNAKKLAMVVAGAVMAGEISLIAALAANTLVSAHMAHNRKK
ncbi:hypothetical protein TrLO_g11995 [Triparma laevis f. longispina]|uniref:3-hydroxy-3-methylglutaryl coenzyme A reductase n=2 Tax=Triparma laevis TaxID=1534972 RepID=A0A9W7F7K6_9STRA|nr:hypothetical protein TrLO_g11995 [Triparma laevis f. longispina]